MNRKFIVAIVVLVAAVLGLHFWAEWEKSRFDASLPQPPAVEEQQVIDDTVDDVAEEPPVDIGTVTSGTLNRTEMHFSTKACTSPMCRTRWARQLLITLNCRKA